MTVNSDADSLARLAESVRQLIGATVTAQASTATLNAAAEQIETVVAELRTHIPDPLPSRYPGSNDSTNPASFFPYDLIFGRFNPLAPPVAVEWQEPKAIGRVSFGTPYEGPPGCVHGAIIAATFDQVFNAANLMSGTPGPTARLEIRYKRPTPLFTELRFEAWRERVEDRKVYAAGRVLVGDNVTVEAEGLFVLISADRVMQLLNR